jgi:hypothetical protein
MRKLAHASPNHFGKVPWSANDDSRHVESQRTTRRLESLECSNDGMLLAAEAYRTVKAGRAVACAKLHHHNNQRCIFRCNFQG